MRLKSLFAAAVALLALVVAAPSKSEAFGDHHRWHGGSKTHHIHHRVYYPRYVHHYHIDPYHYRYSPRGYYPYYGSAYWAPAKYVKRRNRLHYHVWNAQPPRYRYYKSWGYPRKWHHRKWHAKHHGYHHRWHW
jgi:hypothetical protein